MTSFLNIFVEKITAQTIKFGSIYLTYFKWWYLLHYLVETTNLQICNFKQVTYLDLNYLIFNSVILKRELELMFKY